MSAVMLGRIAICKAINSYLLRRGWSLYLYWSLVDALWMNVCSIGVHFMFDYIDCLSGETLEICNCLECDTVVKAVKRLQSRTQRAEAIESLELKLIFRGNKIDGVLL